MSSSCRAAILVYSLSHFSLASDSFDRCLAFAHLSCQTCRMNHFQCPGHFGHIELPQPVFHPLFMTHTYNLLRGSCLFCHRFKIPEYQVSQVREVREG